MLAGIFGTLKSLVMLPVKLILLPFKIVSFVVSLVFYLFVLAILGGFIYLVLL